MKATLLRDCEDVNTNRHHKLYLLEPGGRFTASHVIVSASSAIAAAFNSVGYRPGSDVSGSETRVFACDANGNGADYGSFASNFPIGMPGSVLTCGNVHTPRGSMTTIADLVEFALEFRADGADDLAHLDSALRLIIDDVTTRRGVSIELGPKITTDPVALDPNVRSLLGYHGSLALGSPQRFVREMPSGAGHDAAVFQKHGIPTGMIFIRNERGSHNPQESMRMDDFALATNVLTRAMMDLSL